MAIKVEGVQELEKSMAALAKRYGVATAQGAIAAANLVRTEAVKSIQEVSEGEKTVRYNAEGNGRQVTVSREGDAPNTDTGRLVSSIQVDATAKFVFVGTSLEYGKWLEFGTRHMNARPWLYPALERKRKEIQRIFTLKIEAVTRKGLK